mmetsp:Transcript_1363/g.1679  ORF Transcript_1363/g.1679 Transcript_1363/m.1679 type:complete len:337 (-) Transcript_1363:388-1398(-)|eukprot:CAMPEP_0185792290 /NCGR_PEP_ID=MMETSP1174-20130828/158851_1 /TAXON_ID=35687 /ORGANISM="Dictyocha speculum, Strain CCMP1381" /LENGTH=336 /DNA_ID=CAMNT_0028487339 /DNA_START=728 /DNA_END=1738 /DNA_ORIENTATION=-
MIRTSRGDCLDDFGRIGNGNIENRVGYFSASRATDKEINRRDGHENINQVSEGITVGQLIVSSRMDQEEGVKTQGKIPVSKANHHDLFEVHSEISATAVDRISQKSSNLSNRSNSDDTMTWHETETTYSFINDNHAGELEEYTCASNGNTGNGTININVKSVNTYSASKGNEKSAATITFTLMDVNIFRYGHERVVNTIDSNTSGICIEIENTEYFTVTTGVIGDSARDETEVKMPLDVHADSLPGHGIQASDGSLEQNTLNRRKTESSNGDVRTSSLPDSIHTRLNVRLVAGLTENDTTFSPLDDRKGASVTEWSNEFCQSEMRSMESEDENVET